jgi:hypothetical protein
MRMIWTEDVQQYQQARSVDFGNVFPMPAGQRAFQSPQQIQARWLAGSLHRDKRLHGAGRLQVLYGRDACAREHVHGFRTKARQVL